LIYMGDDTHTQTQRHREGRRVRLTNRKLGVSVATIHAYIR